MLIQATQLRPGMILEYNGGLWRVMTINHITPGNWRGMVQTKLRNIKSGSQTENRFRSEDRVERVILDQMEMEFLYQEGDDFHFMNTQTYDQITLPKDLIADVAGYLTPNLKVEVEYHEATPLNVTLPKTVSMKVVQTDPGIRTVSGNEYAQAGDTRDRAGDPSAAFRGRGRRDHDQHREQRIPLAHQVTRPPRTPRLNSVAK